MTNCSRARGYPGSNYPFLTSKERDNETGLDYFLARYYSSTQGRFTSPDEFTGGPDELYYFVDDASNNPTFYADLRKPQSLNKYQYAFNNPLRYIDPDGHDADEVDPDPQDPCNCQATPAHYEQLGRDINKGLDKAGKGLKEAGKVVVVYAFVKVLEIVVDTFPAPIPPQPIPPQPTTATPPSTQVQPMPPPAPIQANKPKKQSTGKNKDHPKDTERPGRRNTKDRTGPNWRPRERPRSWPPGKPWPPWKNPRPKDWPK